MFKNSFGKHRQIQFRDEHEFYRFLGILSKIISVLILQNF